MENTDDFSRMERDGWANPAIASGYAGGSDFATTLVAKNLANQVGAAQGKSILDLCCGHGVVAAELVARGAETTGLDFSSVMIALARDRVSGATFVEGDAMATDFPDAHFDAVTIGFGVPHLPDQGRGLAEAARVLKPGGRLAFSIWYGKGTPSAFGWLFDAVGRFGDLSVKLPAGPDAHLLTDSSVATEMVGTAGFVDVESHDVASEFWVPQPDALFDIFDRGTVRAAALLSGQTIEQRDAIRRDMAERVQLAGTPERGGYRVPVPSVVISAVRA